MKTPPPVDAWSPCSIDEIQSICGGYTNWFLCGGISLDLLVGRQTRPHGDIDIGLYRSELAQALQSINQGHVYLCDPPGSFSYWNGGPIGDHVNDIWITSADNTRWILQVLVHTDKNDDVIFKRDHRMSWPKSAHTITHNDVRILNPAITLLYKSTRSNMEDKDVLDIQLLIDHYSRV